MSKTQLLEYGWKVALGFGSLSLGVNSWFVQNTFTEMKDSIKELNNRMAEVQIQTAETRRDVIIHERVLSDQTIRLQNTEAILNKLSGYLERKR